MTDNQNWLAAYAQTGSDAAFRELVIRYVDLVYSTAFRLVGGDTHRAEDVSQTVFVKLARVAKTLPQDVKLGGWLHRDTCFTASTLMRGERRRQTRERQAAEMNVLQNNSEADYSLVAPVLDEAINELNDDDRTAILLRFYERSDFWSVGQALGSNEDAARMRVNRALEKLQELLKRRGLITSSAALAIVLSSNAVQAAPVGLVVAISTAVALAGKTITAATIATHATMNWVNLKFTAAIIAAVVVAGTGTHLVQQREVNRLRDENESYVAQQKQLTAERDVALTAAAANQDDLERLRKEQVELLRLRGEVGLLRRQLVSFDDLQTENIKLRTLAQLNTTSSRGTNQIPVVAKVVVTYIKQPRTLSEDQVRTSISIKPGDILSTEAIDLSVSNLARSGVFYNVRAAQQTTPDGVIVEYFVQEKPKLTGIRFAGNTRFRDPDLATLLDSKAGGRLDERILFGDAKKLQSAYQASGLTNANVKYVSHIREDVGEGEVTFEITE